jgi:hypothetical protein
MAVSCKLFSLDDKIRYADLPPNRAIHTLEPLGEALLPLSYDDLIGLHV